MCGITAFLSYTNIDESDIEKLQLSNKEMLYRGPDEQDVWNDSNIGLAHVRLSIIGLKNGHQPIFNETKNIILICNGEIYNYRTLKSALISKGHVFTTESDCEVIVHLYEEYGVECVKYLDGMFSFCIYDKKKQELFVARDPSGKKPLYYSETPKGIVFSSELKVIKNHFLINPKTNYEILRQIQKYTYPISTFDTYIDKIKKIPAGCYGIATKTEGISITRYNERNIVPTFEGSYSEACEQVKVLLKKAVKKRLQSEVPVAILLSAGVDSSAIATIAKEFTDKVHVIAAGYKGSYTVDERAEAKKLAKEKGFIWHEIELDSNDFSNYVNEILPVLDEPVGDIAMFAQWGIYKKSKEMGFTVLLSGNGGDELFYGYERHNAYSKAIESLENIKKDFPITSRKKTLKYLYHIFKNGTLFNLAKQINVPNYTFPVFKSLENFALKNNLPLERTDWHKKEFYYYIDRIYYFLNYAWLTNNCYFLSDKLAMAHSIEVRCPFADKDLIDFVDTLSIEYKFPNQLPKKLLKDSLQDILPKYVLERKKTGFEPPPDYIRNLVNDYTSKFFHEKPTTYAQLLTDFFSINP